MKLYVSGQMTWLPDLGFPLFQEAARDLRGAGYVVVNPAEINTDPNADWLACMRADIAALIHCDGVALLPNWPMSRGAAIERRLAEDLGLRVASVADWLHEARTDNNT